LNHQQFISLSISQYSKFAKKAIFSPGDAVDTFEVGLSVRTQWGLRIYFLVYSQKSWKHYRNIRKTYWL